MTMVADAKQLIDRLGEDVTYLPKGGGTRAIKAMVERGEPVTLPAGDGHTPAAQVHVVNDVTDGITSAELDKGGDKLRFAPRIGGATRDYAITNILYQDGGMMGLEVR
ncbi:MAG: cupin domain-containing protein [Planctomycetota bacterium]|jgi:hypothetical protein